MKTITESVQVVDASTGKVIKQRAGGWSLLPPAADACPVCGHRPLHSADQPHNVQSLYYQYAFYADHGRWPTWRDAIAHCPEPVRAAWEAELRRRGAWPADEVAA